MSSSRWSAFAHRADIYPRRVLGDADAGELIVAGPLVRFACHKHLERRERSYGGAHPRGYYFNEESALHPISSIENVLKLPDAIDDDGNHKPFLLLPWQDFIVGSLFGWKRADGRRLYRDAFLLLGKGAGKTLLKAAIGIYMLVLDPEMAPEIYSAAPTRDQSEYLFRDAMRMVEASPELSRMLHVSVGNIANAQNSGVFRTCSSEHRGLDGKRASCALLDEVQEHPTALVTTKIRANAKGRRQPLFIESCNAGFDLSSIAWQHYEHSRKVLEGTVEDDAWFSYVCALDEGDDPLSDPTCWVKANPSLGHTIQSDYLERQVATAKNIPAEHDTILRLNFCVWTRAAARFFDMQAWRACPGDVPEPTLVGLPCFAAIDLGPSDDFAAFVMVWLLPNGGAVVRPRFWLPAVALERYPDRPYGHWQRAGAVFTVTDGDVTDWGRIEAEVLRACQAAGVRELVYDKRFAEHLAQNLMAAGVTCVKVPQGFHLNEAIKRVSEWVVARTLHHGHNPVMTWMADGAVAMTGYSGEVRLDKRDSRSRIEGIVALAMAVSRALVAPPAAEHKYQVFVFGGAR